MSQPRPPGDLGDEGKKLWRGVQKDLAEADLVPDSRELLMLRRCCRMADRIAEMERQLDGADYLQPGYMGKGVVCHPLLTELRMTEALLAQTLSRLKPPAEDDSSAVVPVPRSVSARAAANTRWKGAR
jgi:hypothetical protein